VAAKSDLPSDLSGKFVLADRIVQVLASVDPDLIVVFESLHRPISLPPHSNDPRTIDNIPQEQDQGCPFLPFERPERGNKLACHPARPKVYEEQVGMISLRSFLDNFLVHL